MGDCERGTLAVTTSEKISKKQLLIKYTKKSRQKGTLRKYITRHSQIPTQIRNVIFNFPGTGFLKKQCNLTLPILSSPLFSVPLYPPILLPDPPSIPCHPLFILYLLIF